ncbi:hypothetical protein QFC21_006304 [Naganishia friedmannii]|uniref:Uncharacterized protein n=1 Tax=Naganishia friedmannii TaxID=89922 RepID=A0ACC2V3M4_9TREE|nr:hypothetical protein QFC21_006304 [Naganishia friedmannii]
MDKLSQFGVSIGEHAGPTFALYFPLLAAKVDAGEFQEPTEHRYGPSERHVYDLYLPPSPSDTSSSTTSSQVGKKEQGKTGKAPTIVFIHGGGMVQGDKQIEQSRGGAHRNIGTFFAERGYMVEPCKRENGRLGVEQPTAQRREQQKEHERVEEESKAANEAGARVVDYELKRTSRGRHRIIPNYRLRIPDTSNPLYATPANASFPSGGIDIALLLRHLSAPACHVSHLVDPESLTLVGNSAGAVHAATYLYRDAIPGFEDALAPLATDPTLTPSNKELTPSGAMFIGMPAHFRAATPDRNAVLFGYHCPELFDQPAGAAEEEKEKRMKGLVEERCPVGLRKGSGDGTRVGTMLAELDPETEIAGPSREFTKTYEQVTGKQAQELFIAGHNHISVPLGLGLGGKEEAWGGQLVQWIEEGRK